MMRVGLALASMFLVSGANPELAIQGELVPEPPVFEEPIVEPITPPAPSGPIVYVLHCEITGYTPADPTTPYTGVTSTGVLTADDPHGIAADPRIIPYGAQIRVPGYSPTKYRPSDSWWPVDDTGGSLRKSWRNDGVVHLDLRFRTLRAARNWGVRWVDVEVVLPDGLSERQAQNVARRAIRWYQLP